MTLNPTSMTLRRFFAGVVEYIFEAELGVADPPLIDYLSNLLYRFLRSDAVHRVRALNGRPVMEVGELVAEAEARVGEARREVHRHIGDFTLFWAGLFPEALRRGSPSPGPDQFIDYCQQGKRAYLIASQIETARTEEAPGEVLERLSLEFEMCAYGLREIRREWERRDGGGDAPRPLLFG